MDPPGLVYQAEKHRTKTYTYFYTWEGDDVFMQQTSVIFQQINPLRDIVLKNQAVSVHFTCWGRKMCSYPHIMSGAI